MFLSALGVVVMAVLFVFAALVALVSAATEKPANHRRDWQDSPVI